MKRKSKRRGKSGASKTAPAIFLREVVSIRYRSKRTGRFVKRRKGSRRVVTRRMEEVRGGVVTVLGYLPEGGKERIARTDAVDKNLFIRDEIVGAVKAARGGFKGLEVVVVGKGRGGRAVKIKTRILLSARERRDVKALSALVTGRVLDSLRAREYRLSTLKIGGRSKRNRARTMLKNARLTISGFY